MLKNINTMLKNLITNMFVYPCFQALVGLACDLGLDSLNCCADNKKWIWFRRYCLAMRVASSLIQRTALPHAFCLEVPLVSHYIMFVTYHRRGSVGVYELLVTEATKLLSIDQHLFISILVEQSYCI